MDKLAIKRLTASDCTLFEAVYRKIGAGNQKSINLNADVLTGEFYPSLASIAAATDNEIPVVLSIYGPEAKAAYKIARKIIKNSSYKNWRLNGEFINGPPEEPTRYDAMEAGDLAVMRFRGDAAPSGIDMILLRKSSDDGPLHTELSRLFGARSMISVSASDIAAALSATGTSESHPIYILAENPELDAALEDAALGGEAGTRRLLRNRGRRKVSPANLSKAKLKAEATGADGEGLVNAFLAAELSARQIVSYEWSSVSNAVCPYDFCVEAATGEKFVADAKSTAGPFENPIHVSLSEVVEAASGPTPYLIYRMYEVSDSGGKMRISEDFKPLAQKLKEIHEAHVPPEVRVDSFSISTSALSWGPERIVLRPEE